jgi:hypothetical protein
MTHQKLVTLENKYIDGKNVFVISAKDVKTITSFIINSKLIFHPTISPDGTPDFSLCYKKNYELTIDRNILTKLSELCKKGELKDKLMMKTVGSLMFWVVFNNITISAGLALNEYANNKNADIEANAECAFYKMVIDFYGPKIWQNLALERIFSIPKMELPINSTKTVFNISSEHFKMHYAEMLHIVYLYFKTDYSKIDKIIAFLHWNNSSLIVCQYTIIYMLLLFTKRIKQIDMKLILNFNMLLNKCHNQAWDLTYLSHWSTLYWNENKGSTCHLFSTMDKDLKKIFITTHSGTNVYTSCLGSEKGLIVQQEYDKIIKTRIKPIMDSYSINKLVETELNLLKNETNKYQI